MNAMRKWQLSAVERLREGCSMLIYPYGSGKTWTVLAAAMRQWEKQDRKGLAAFVTCPLRNMLTWHLEIERRYPDALVLPTLNIQAVRDAVKGTRPVIWLFPHTRIRTFALDLRGLMRELRPAALIMDESTAIKNPKAAITQGAIDISTAAPESTLRIAMTGKAMPEGAREIWSQFQFCYPRNNPLGDSYYRFLMRWFIKADFGYALKLDLSEQFYNLVRKHCVVMHPDDEEAYLAYIGDKVPNYATEIYQPSTEQKKLLNFLYSTWSLPGVTAEGSIDSKRQARHIEEDLGEGEEFSYTMSLLMKSAQISSGFYYDKHKHPVYLDSNPKAELLGDVASILFTEDPERQIIVWYRFAAEVSTLIAVLGQYGVVQGPDEYALRSFAAKMARVILMPMQVTKGFNELANADTAIFYSSTYSQEARDQAEARNTGARQLHPNVTIVDLIGQGMIDADIQALLISKNLSKLALKNVVNKYNRNYAKEVE